MKDITKKATEIYPAGTQNALQFRTGFIEGAKLMKKEIIEKVWNIIFEIYLKFLTNCYGKLQHQKILQIKLKEC